MKKFLEMLLFVLILTGTLNCPAYSQTDSSKVEPLPGSLSKNSPKVVVETDDYGNIISRTFKHSPNNINQVNSSTFNGSIAPAYQFGWPIQISDERLAGELTVADVDNDGNLNVIAVSDDYGSTVVRVFDISGNLMSGWPQKVYLKSIQGINPIVADIDNDQDLEIAIHNKFFHHDGQPVAGWPKKVGYTPIQITSVADINQDGKLEIIGVNPNFYRNSANPDFPGSQIYVWDTQGALLPNFPINLPTVQSSSQWEYTEGLRMATVGDLDGNGDLEIVAPAYLSNLFSGVIGHVYAFHYDGQPVGGWPKEIIKSSMYKDSTIIAASTGDVTGDGKDEVFVINDSLNDYQVQVFGFSGNGINLTGFPKLFLESHAASPTVSFGDLDNDNNFEIVFTTMGMDPQTNDYYVDVHVYNGEDGSNFKKWPMRLNKHRSSLFINWAYDFGVSGLWSSPIIFNVKNIVPKKDGDSWDQLKDPKNQIQGLKHIEYPLIKKVIGLNLGKDDVSNMSRSVFLLNAYGKNVGGAPFDINAAEESTSLYAVDMDQDGDLELGTVTNGRDAVSYFCDVHFFDMNMNGTRKHDYPMWAHDIQRTNRAK